MVHLLRSCRQAVLHAALTCNGTARSAVLSAGVGAMLPLLLVVNWRRRAVTVAAVVPCTSHSNVDTHNRAAPLRDTPPPGRKNRPRKTEFWGIGAPDDARLCCFTYFAVCKQF